MDVATGQRKGIAGYFVQNDFPTGRFTTDKSSKKMFRIGVPGWQVVQGNVPVVSG